MRSIIHKLTLPLLHPILEPMKRRIEFELPIEPVAWGRVKRGQFGQAYVPEKTRRYEREVALLTRSLNILPRLRGPLKLTARFILQHPKKFQRNHPDVKPDLDNLMKALKDGLKGVLFDDDCQICQYGDSTGKFYDMTGGKPRIHIVLEELE